MTETASNDLVQRYDQAAGGWGDKMRALGYCDAYLGFLSMPDARINPDGWVLDIGSGSGAFAEAWVAMHGRQAAGLTLLDPSARMLDRAAAALSRRNVQTERAVTTLEAYTPPRAHDHLLAAHVIEHCPDPAVALRHMRRLVRPGGTLWLVASKPHWCNAIIWLQWRHRTFQKDEIALLLAETGWALERTHAFPAGPPSRTSRGYLARAV